MQIVSYILCIVGAFFNLYVLVRCYAKVNDTNVKIDLRNVMVLLSGSFFTLIVNNFLKSNYKIIFLFLITFFVFKLIINEDFMSAFYASIIFYILLLFCDLLSSCLVFILPFKNYKYLEPLGFYKVLLTVLDSLFLILIFKLKKVSLFIAKFMNLLKEKLNVWFIVIILLLLMNFLIITYFHVLNFNFNSFIVAIIISLSFLIMCYFFIKEYVKNMIVKQEQQSLLNIMSEYEGMLEKDRINRHEMINNLLVLKSFDDKNSDKYKEILDDIIKEYQENKSKTYRSLYSLPNGVKGIVYYKMSNIIDQGIEFTSEISNMVYEEFDKLESKLYYKVCKIVGILIDNAIEAAVDTKEKFILIEMFKQKNTLNIIIENSFNNNVDLNDINKKGFSTKGKNRGYGLHIVNKLVKSSDDIFFKQSISNSKFLSELKITPY